MNNITFNLGMLRLWLPQKILLIMNSASRLISEADKRQILMRANLIIIMMTTCLLQVSAATFAQKFTYAKNDATYGEVFKEIIKQTGYKILYSDQILDKTTIINVNFKGTALKEVMEILLKNQPLTYEIDETTILIKEKTPSFLDRVVSAFANIDVRGIVLDETGNPLVGATVKVKDLGKSTKTNEKGEFFLKGVEENAVLVISYLGYETKEVNAAKDLGKVQMVMADSKLEEVEINAGYYTVKDKERTGSISRVTSETIAKQPVSNPLGALIGRMPGVNIEQQSGINGGGYKVEIRGINSLRVDGRQPLYLIDGVPYPSTSITAALSIGGISQIGSPLNYISPNDIESIEVLKDADATAIYGSRGANGVILIKTKSAKISKSSIDINVYSGISKISKKLELLNTEQYLVMRNEAFKNDNAVPALTDYDVNGTWDKNRYTDWQKELIGGTAHSTNVQAAITGGNELTQFAFRGNYSKNGTVNPGNFNDQKGSGALTVNHISSNKKLKVNLSSAYTTDVNNLPMFDLTTSINLPPNAPALYDSNGNLNWALNSNGAATWNNPLGPARNDYIGKTNTFISSGLISYEIIPGLYFKNSLGYNNIKLKESILRPLVGKAPSPSATGSNSLYFNSIETWIFEPQINYRRKVDKGTLDILIGGTLQSERRNSESLSGNGYLSDLLLKSITAAPSKGAGSTSSQYKYEAIFGRINYNYQDKYLINLTGRRDGSSRFGPEKQFANFGALGFAWIFTNEAFIKKIVPVLSFGKLRTSYGITGSDQIPDYGYFETYSATAYPYQDGSGLFPTRLANPDYSWETNKKSEVAIDLGFIQDRILFSASWYLNQSSNQLVGYTLPDITGFSSIQYNLPATVQNKGWEFDLNTLNISNKKLSWKTTFNLTIPRNKLLSYPNIKGSTYVNTYTVGESLYSPRSYHYLGVDSQTGLYTFEDINKSGTTDIGDRIAVHKSLTSQLYGGVNNSISFKEFSVDIFVQFVNKTLRNPFTPFLAPGRMNNQPIEVLQRWQKLGDETKIQKFSQSFVIGGANEVFNNLTSSDDFTDASFIRLKNLSISWNAPLKYIQKFKLQNLRLYLQGQNLFTGTSYLGDPEVGNLKTLPSLYTITAGIHITL